MFEATNHRIQNSVCQAEKLGSGEVWSNKVFWCLGGEKRNRSCAGNNDLEATQIKRAFHSFNRDHERCGSQANAMLGRCLPDIFESGRQDRM